MVLGAIILALALVAVQLWTSDFGLDERMTGTSRLVTAVDPGGAAGRAGIAAGDVIVGDPGGETLSEAWTEREVYGRNYRLGRALAAGEVPMTIQRGAERLDVVMKPDRARPSLPAVLRQLRRMGTQIPVTFAFLSVAALLRRRRRSTALPADDEARRVVAVSCAMLGPSFVVNWPAPAWPIWLYPIASVVEVGGSAIGGGLLVYFAWSYPTRSAVVDRTLARLAFVAFGTVCAIFSSLNTLHVFVPPYALRGNTANMLFGAACAIAIFAGLSWQRHRAGDLISRRRATWLLTFFGVGMFVPVVAFMIPQYAFGLSSPILQVISLPFALLIPIGFATVVTRYRLFSLDGFASRAGPYAVAIATSLVVCVIVTVAMQAIFSSHQGTAELGQWFGTVVALVLIEPLRRASRVLIDRAFARDRDAFLRRCAVVAANVARHADADAIESELRATLDARAARLMGLEELVESDEARRSLHAHLARVGAARTVELPDAAAVDALLELDLELVVAVPSGDPDRHETRVLALTLPEATRSLTRPEHDALALVGRVIGATLSRDAARRKLETELVRADRERRQIAMELHDGIGATLTAARSMTRRLRAPSQSPEAQTIDALDARLRDALGDLRASLWGLDSVDVSWEALVAKIRRQCADLCAAEGIVFTMSTDGQLGGAMYPGGRLAILRVIQEAVSNAVKHGEPRHLAVRMRVHASRIEVVVEDDGRGFVSKKAEGRGLGNMARRIEGLAGTFSVETNEEAGTRVAVSVPTNAVARSLPPPTIVGQA